MSTNLTSLQVNIVTPDGASYHQDDVSMVVGRALDGEFGIMKDHEPLVAALQVAPVRIKTADKEDLVAVFGGFLEVKDNVVTIISQNAETADYIDVERALRARERALARIDKPTPDIDLLRAEHALQRAIIRLQVGRHD